MKRPFRIAMVAGETSGDLLAARLIAELKARQLPITFYGIGGSGMMAQGFDSLWPMEKLSVMGYLEVIKRFRELLSIRNQLKKRLLQDPPDLFIGVDAPDFNLGLEIDLKAHGIPTIHYVSPSIWAWRGKRIHKIAKAVNRVLALFPMEPPLYEAAGIPVTYTGHPMADQIPLVSDKKAMRQKLNLPGGIPIYAFLPGSRKTELEYLADIFVQTALKIRETQENALFLVPLATRETRLLFEMALYKNEAPPSFFRLMFGHAREAIAASDIVLAASGTVTLEAALIKRPIVIAYKISEVTYRLVKWQSNLLYAGLPNILAGKQIVPEFLQNEATPENLSQALIRLIGDQQNTEFLEKEFTRIHLELRQDSTKKAADAVIGMLPR